MISPTGTIPERLMYPDKKQEVMDWLAATPGNGRWKLEVFMGWAMTVGVRVRQFEMRAVERTGLDVVPGEVPPAGWKGRA